MHAIRALGYIGPPAKGAVPSRIRVGDQCRLGVRAFAVMALGDIHAEPDRVVARTGKRAI